MSQPTPRSASLILALLSISLCAFTTFAVADEKANERRVPLLLAPAGLSLSGLRVQATGSAVVNFSELARLEALRGQPQGPDRPRVLEEDFEEPAEPIMPPSLESAPAPALGPLVASPSPTVSFMGLDDIRMTDSLYIVIPPDVGGAVGQTKILQGLNNNYRILNKADGSVISTVGTATFWAPTGTTALNALTDPRTLYDPINNRWIVVMQTFVSGGGEILVGVSQTSDPSGNWNLFRYNTGATIDFPTVGFNKNWIAVSINRYTGVFQRGITLVVNYPQLRSGTFSATLFNQTNGTHFCSAPCATYSATSDTLYVVTHLSSGAATYVVDTITGSVTPTYTTGSSKTRPGGGWQQPSGQALPQSAPISGVSACNPPCLIETQDAQIRSAPMFRGGNIYYTQTILPPSGPTHTLVQWTQLTTPSGNFVDGGRLEDPTADATNGGLWYAYPHIAVNSVGDFIVGFSQFSSAQHPAAGYAMHLAADAAGSLRDPFIYKAGEDYYHKDFASGRNRWGDFSQAQVDPSDDRSLWVVQEYAKTRTGTDDGTTGSNSSKWSTYWANIAGPVPTVTLAPGPSVNEGNAGTTAFNFTVNLSAPYSLPVTVNYQTSDGTAKVSDNDYQAATNSIVISPGSSSGTITINVNGDTNCESDETFGLSLTGATNGTVGAPATATGTILNDESFTITASAGSGGSISPSGAVSVACNTSQGFTITPSAGHHIVDVLVDGSSAGAVTNFNFPSVSANHTISASFAVDVFTINASAGAGGSIAPSGAVSVNSGADQAFTITPATGYHVADVLVDGGSVGVVTTYTFFGVVANHTIAASFAVNAYTLQVNKVGKGSVAKNPDQPNYDHGTSVQLTATPDSGFAFSGWSGDTTAATNPLDLPMIGNRVMTATFIDVAPPIAHVVVANGGETWLIGNSVDFEWTSADNDTVTSVDLFLSRNGGAGPFESIASSLPSSGLYSWTVTAPATDSALAKVVAHDAASHLGEDTSDSLFTISEPTAVNDRPVARLSFEPVRPNPTTSSAQFTFGLPKEARVELSVLDVRGRVIAVLASGVLPPGWHTAVWSGQTAVGRASPGVYFGRLTTEGKRMVQRFAMVR